MQNECFYKFSNISISEKAKIMVSNMLHSILVKRNYLISTEMRYPVLMDRLE